MSTIGPARGDDVTFLNYGYAVLDGDGNHVGLRADDSDDLLAVELYQRELYQRVAGAGDLRGKDVLEVGCGRGGGSSFIARHLGARTMTGVDFAAPAVEFCRRHHRLEGLAFLEGDAENLPFAPASFDAVVNVESSHCYASFEGFLQQVSRVLRPGGDFLFADLRPRGEVAKMREQLRRLFSIVEEESITANVFRALEICSERRRALILDKTPTLFRQATWNFAAVEGTAVFEALRAGELEYVRFVLQKGESGETASEQRPVQSMNSPE